jgi:nitroimidazol reductase NimA-like FMN-containing flavoprotein (pyridoxamine 5'-phosphate oxidase superfamily)
MTTNEAPHTLHGSSRVLPLDEAECRSRLRSRTLGRIAVKLADDLVIMPVYYALMDDDIVFRTAPGTKLSAAVLKTKVAFEVDGAAPGWSVLVRGHVEEIGTDDEQARARTLLGSEWPAGERDRLVRIRAEQITGRWLLPLP